MRSKNKALLGILNKNRFNCPTFLCVSHHQAIFSKEIGMHSVLYIAVKIINKIRWGHKALTHRKFKDFLKNLNSDYGSLALYTEVRLTQ